MPSSINHSSNSWKVRATSTNPANSSRSASAFLAVHGPINTIFTSSPLFANNSFRYFACAIIGETIFTKLDTFSGLYFSI